MSWYSNGITFFPVFLPHLLHPFPCEIVVHCDHLVDELPLAEMLATVRTIMVRVPVVVTSEHHPSAADRATAQDGAVVLIVEPGAQDDAEIGERDLSVSHQRPPCRVPGAASYNPIHRIDSLFFSVFSCCLPAVSTLPICNYSVHNYHYC